MNGLPADLNPFTVGDLAQHRFKNLDARRVAAIEGNMIRLDIFGVVTDLLPASNYEKVGE